MVMFEVTVRVPLRTEGGEPLGVLTGKVPLHVDDAVLASTADGGEPVRCRGSVSYAGGKYDVDLPVEQEFLRMAAASRRLTLLHPPVTVEPVEVNESVASRPGVHDDGRRLVVVARRYLTVEGGWVSEAGSKTIGATKTRGAKR